MQNDQDPGPHIVVVGPCAAGKTTLVNNLRPKGYNIHACAQEHSSASQLWRWRSQPAALIFLDAELSTIARRQNRQDWTQRELDEQHVRLADARRHSDFYVQTDTMTREQVADAVERFLQQNGLQPGREET
jgi:broad-specificity NMP kinase